MVPHTIYSRFLFLTICVSIVLSALAYGTVHYWAMAMFSLAGLGVVFLWLADGWRLGTLRVSRNVLQLPLLGMVALGLFQLLPVRSADSGALAAGRTLSFDPYSTRLVIVQVVTLLIFFAAALVFIDTPHRLRIIVRTIAIFGFLLAIFGMTQSFTSPTKVYWVRELAQSTAFGPFINRHHFAGYMELALAIPLGLLFSGAIEGEKKLLYIFAVGLMGVALILTNSRGGIISLVAEIIFLVVIVGLRRRHHARDSAEKRRRVRSGIVRAVLALALIIGIVAATVLFGGEQALTRFVGSVNTDDPTTGRAHFWNVTLDIIRAHPFIGTGLGAFGVVYTRYDTHNGLYRLEQAHNDYLQVLSDGGIVGAALGLFFVLALFRMGLQRRESGDEFRRGVATGALAGCFAVLVHSFFDFTLHTTANALLFLILAALATLNGRVEGRKRTRRRRRRHSDQQSPISHQQSANAGVASKLIADYPKIFATAFTTRVTSASEVRQLQTLTRIARRPRQVVPPKKASPEAWIAAITSSVRRS
jgi:O-antigen ligase